MAKYRQVHTTFWDDGFVIDLTPEEKYFYLYLMTNNNTTQCGIYELPYRVIEMHTGYNRDTVVKLLQRFKEYGKIEYNEATKEIMLTNWAKYNFINSPKVKKCIEKELQTVKHKVFVKAYLDSLEQLGYRIDTVSIDLGEEREEEKEEEQEEEREEEVKPASPPPSPIDDSFLKIKSFFEQHFRPATFRDAQDIDKLLNYHLDADLIIEAMKIALDRSKPYINYIDGILRRWSTEQGINTYQDFLQKGGNPNGIDGQQNGSDNGRTPEEMGMLAKLRNFTSTPSAN